MIRRLIRRPFKGTSAYEWQIGPFVLQIPFGEARTYECYESRILGVHVWHDHYWKGFR